MCSNLDGDPGVVLLLVVDLFGLLQGRHLVGLALLLALVRRGRFQKKPGIHFRGRRSNQRQNTSTDKKSDIVQNGLI